MRLWLLRPVYDGNAEPWNPWYDKTFGFVVRAETESDARKFASADCGGEGENAWLDSDYSTCEALTADGTPAVIIKDHARA